METDFLVAAETRVGQRRDLLTVQVKLLGVNEGVSADVNLLAVTHDVITGAVLHVCSLNCDHRARTGTKFFLRRGAGIGFVLRRDSVRHVKHETGLGETVLEHDVVAEVQQTVLSERERHSLERTEELTLSVVENEFVVLLGAHVVFHPSRLESALTWSHGAPSPLPSCQYVTYGGTLGHRITAEE